MAEEKATFSGTVAAIDKAVAEYEAIEAQVADVEKKAASLQAQLAAKRAEVAEMYQVVHARMSKFVSQPVSR